VIDSVVEANPDALLLAPGQADLLQRRVGREKPALVLRVDAPNVYGREVPEIPVSTQYDDPVGMAVRLDAACVVTNLLDSPGQPSLRQSCVENVMRLRGQCDRAGMPMMVEPVPMAPATAGYDVHRDPERLRGLVRQAVELGADVIKADPTDDLDDYARVLEVAGSVPLLVRGGGRATVEEILRRTFTVIELGASGIVYGRNVIQHERPAAMTRALMAVVHDGASPEEALELLSA
jgi:class I fructose-bisphosphate aldolase